MKLFPNFISEFNALLSVDYHVASGGECSIELPMELRIFALMRLGVSDAEEVAHFFDLSVNTIYAYKIKVKSRSIVGRECFYSRVMAIELSDRGW